MHPSQNNFNLKKMKEIFKIKDYEFGIQTAYLDAFVDDDQLAFGIHIKALPRKKSVESKVFDTDTEFYFYSESLFLVEAGKISHWQDIDGLSLSWEEVDEDQEPAFMQVFDTEIIEKATIQFEKHNSKMWVRISGLCDVYYDDDFSQDLPFEICCEVDFYGILFGKENEEYCWKKIAPFLPSEGLKFFKNQYDVAILAPEDTDTNKNVLILGDY